MGLFQRTAKGAQQILLLQQADVGMTGAKKTNVMLASQEGGIQMRKRLLPMKKCLLPVSFALWYCLAVALGTGTAHAEVRDFVSYSIDVPANWHVEQEGVGVSLMQAEERCGIDIVAAPHQNVPFRELCIFFYEQLRGTGAKGDDDGFTFTSQNEYNLPSTVRLTLQGETFLVVTVSGNCNNLQNVVKSLTTKAQGARPWPVLPEAQLRYSFSQQRKEAANTASQETP